MDGMHAEWYIESTLNKIGLRLAGWLGLPVGARVGTRVFKTFLRHNTNQYFEPCFRSKCLFVNLFELVVLLTGSFDNMIHHLGIMPRAWLESTFICRSKRAQYLKATIMSFWSRQSNSQSVRATMVAVRSGSSPIMATSPNDVTACMVLRCLPSVE